ncbi:MAG TPA: VOC family protein [Gemmatimonadales bacterium]|jgi:methylmalonyl-CoA/ethylmalonyl-CoA epimerase|nr:VOC family protein [Gemmatimonadales bacterium]
MTATPPAIERIGQVYVTAHDLDRAVRFYRDTLGLSFLFQVPRMAFFDCGGVRLMLGIPDAPEFDHPASIIYYRVSDIAAAHDTLVRRGVTFRQPPHLVAKLATFDLYLADFHDSEGNALALMSEVAKA